jgi:hypothetical protein
LVWFGLVWFGLVWFGLVWFGLVWFGLVWFGLFCFVLLTTCSLAPFILFNLQICHLYKQHHWENMEFLQFVL